MFSQGGQLLCFLLKPTPEFCGIRMSRPCRALEDAIAGKDLLDNAMEGRDCALIDGQISTAKPSSTNQTAKTVTSFQQQGRAASLAEFCMIRVLGLGTAQIETQASHDLALSG